MTPSSDETLFQGLFSSWAPCSFGSPESELTKRCFRYFSGIYVKVWSRKLPFWMGNYVTVNIPLRFFYCFGKFVRTKPVKREKSRDSSLCLNLSCARQFYLRGLAQGEHQNRQRVEILHVLRNKIEKEVLPPTSDSLQQHMKCSNYQINVWWHSFDITQDLVSPEGQGWEMKDGNFTPAMTKPRTNTKKFANNATCHCKKSECRTNRYCNIANLSYAETCVCMGDETCRNPHGLISYSSAAVTQRKATQIN